MPRIERLLITGGCGFIGANLVRYLRERTSWELRVVDDLRAGSEAFVPEGLAEVRIGDAADGAVLEASLEGIDAVVHLASQTGVAPSVEDPASDFQGNPAVTFRVLDSCRRRGVDGVVFASSGAALGDVSPPLHEEVVPRPVSPYGAGKLAGEAYCGAFAAAFGMSTVSLRFANVYGPFSTHKRNAVPSFLKLGLTGRPLVIYGEGSQTRDFIYVDDLCEAILLSLTTDGIAGEVFQVATGAETSVLELASLVLEVVGGSSEIRFEPSRPGEVHRSVADISKARRTLGFAPRTSLREGLLRTAAWYREHWTPDEE